MPIRPPFTPTIIPQNLPPGSQFMGIPWNTTPGGDQVEVSHGLSYEISGIQPLDWDFLTKGQSFPSLAKLISVTVEQYPGFPSCQIMFLWFTSSLVDPAFPTSN